MVDEFRTSCKCSNCDGGVCEKYMVRKNPRPKTKKNTDNPKKERKHDEMRLVHGLLRCKSGCGSWNRDRNGSSNIYKIAYQAIHKLERPSYLCRETNCDIKSQSLGVSVSRLCRETKHEIKSNQAVFTELL